MNIFKNILMLLSLELFFYKVQPRFILCESTALVHFLVHAPWFYPFPCIKNALLHPLTRMTSVWVVILPGLSCWLCICSWSFGFAFMTLLPLFLLVYLCLSCSSPGALIGFCFSALSSNISIFFFHLIYFRGRILFLPMLCIQMHTLSSSSISPAVFWVVSSAYPTHTTTQLIRIEQASLLLCPSQLLLSLLCSFYEWVFRLFVQFPKPVVWEPLTPFLHSKQHIQYILLLAYLSYLIRLQFQLIRSINSFNYCNTILDICSDFNSYFHISFHSNPGVQIQINWLCLLTVGHWHLMTHSIQNLKFFSAWKTPIHISYSSGKFFRTYWNVLS